MPVNLSKLLAEIIKHLPGQHLQTSHAGKKSNEAKIRSLKAEVTGFINGDEVPLRKKKAIQMSMDANDWLSVAKHLEDIDVASASDEDDGELGKGIVEHGQSFPTNTKIRPSGYMRAHAQDIISKIGGILYE